MVEKKNIVCVTDVNKLFNVNLGSIDYIFSIVNSEILSTDLIKLARYGAINYHDSPLPKYAGVNSTSWAIINHEKRHGVTWHRVSNKLDAGDIVKQRIFPIDDGDTAFILNLRCYEQAILSFADMVNDIEQESLLFKKQSPVHRNYFGIGHVLPNFGFIDWENFTADFIVRINHALTLGHYNNNVGTLKIYFKEHYLIVPNIEISPIECKAGTPGIVLAIQDNALYVSTSNHAVKIDHFVSNTGVTLTVDDVVKRYGIEVGFKFAQVEKQAMEEFKELYSHALRSERFWIDQLKDLTGHTTFSPQSIKKDKKVEVLDSVIRLDSRLKSLDISTQGNTLLDETATR